LARKLSLPLVDGPPPNPKGRLRFRPSRYKALNLRISCMPTLDAIVLVVDEKSHVQALERAQGYRKLPNGRALSGRAPGASGHRAVGNAGIVGIAGISYRYFEHVCDVCEHKCSDWTSKERDKCLP